MQNETAFFKQFIESKGLIFTQERYQIAEEVFSNHEHFDAEALLRVLKDKGSKTSRATVYRTLDLLIESNLVKKIDLGGGRAAYEHTAGHAHHDHLICLACGKVREFEEPLIEQLQDWACEKANFIATGHSLNIYGYCKGCESTIEKS